MNRALWCCGVVLLFALFGCPQKKDTERESNATLPDFPITTLDGRTLDFSSFAGSVVVLDFWATWCKPCLHEIPYYNALIEKYKGQNFKMVGLEMASGDGKTLSTFIEKNNIKYPVYIGTPAAAMAVGGVEGFPKTYLFDQRGNVVTSFLGIHPDKIPEIDKLTEKLLSQEVANR